MGKAKTPWDKEREKQKKREREKQKIKREDDQKLAKFKKTPEVLGREIHLLKQEIERKENEKDRCTTDKRKRTSQKDPKKELQDLRKKLEELKALYPTLLKIKRRKAMLASGQIESYDEVDSDQENEEIQAFIRAEDERIVNNLSSSQDEAFNNEEDRQQVLNDENSSQKQPILVTPSFPPPFFPPPPPPPPPVPGFSEISTPLLYPPQTSLAPTFQQPSVQGPVGIPQGGYYGFVPPIPPSRPPPPPGPPPSTQQKHSDSIASRENKTIMNSQMLTENKETTRNTKDDSQLLASRLVKRGLLELPKDYRLAPPPPPVANNSNFEQVVSGNNESGIVSHEVKKMGSDVVKDGTDDFNTTDLSNKSVLNIKLKDDNSLSKNPIGPSKPATANLNKGKMRFIPSSVKRKPTLSSTISNRNSIFPMKRDESDLSVGNTSGNNVSSLIPKVTVIRQKKDKDEADNAELEDFFNEIGTLDDTI